VHDPVIVFFDLNLVGRQRRQRLTSFRIDSAGMPVRFSRTEWLWTVSAPKPSRADVSEDA